MTRHCDGASRCARSGIDWPHVRTHQSDSPLGFMNGGNAIFPEHSNRVGIGALNFAYDRWFHNSSACDGDGIRVTEYSVGSETCQADFGVRLRITLSYFGFVKPFALQDMRTSPLRINRRSFPLVSDKYFGEIGDAGIRSVC